MVYLPHFEPLLLGRVASILESFRVHCGLEDFQVWSLLVRATVARSVASDHLQVFEFLV